jgi:hypothetical protein
MVELVFGRVRLGAISNPHFSDQTWYGVLLVDPPLKDGATGRRILAYKDFSEDWNERLYHNQDSPPDAAEFDEYVDLVDSAEWAIVNHDEGISHHVDAPVFFKGGEFTCRPWEFTHPKG